MERPTRHLEITDEFEAGTLCGDLPHPGPSEETLTFDPREVTCIACSADYAAARLAHLVFGAAEPRATLAAILRRHDAENAPTAAEGDGVEHAELGAGRVAMVVGDNAIVSFRRDGHCDSVPLADLRVVAPAVP